MPGGAATASPNGRHDASARVARYRCRGRRKWTSPSVSGLLTRSVRCRSAAGALGELREQGSRSPRTADARNELAEFAHEDLEIRQRLTTDQSNAQWRRDLSISYERLGDSLNAVGQLAPALAAFRESIAIRQALAEADPNNTTRQRDLAVSHGRIGNTQLALGRREEGLDALRKSLAIREVLARDDPANVLWQTDLVIALRSLARAGDEARPRLTRALEIARTLANQGRLGADQFGWAEALQRELVVPRTRRCDARLSASRNIKACPRSLRLCGGSTCQWSSIGLRKSTAADVCRF